MAGGEEGREKNNYPLVALEHSMFLINKSSFLKLVKGLKGQKLKLRYLYFIPKSSLFGGGGGGHTAITAWRNTEQSWSRRK